VIVFFSFQDGCDDYIEQLIPTTQPIPKIKMKVFGDSGVGKTTLIESMRAGYFSGLFRRSKRNSGSRKGLANGKEISLVQKKTMRDIPFNLIILKFQSLKLFRMFYIK
jgi:ABC-type molybdate transport system ATPase subunit